MTLMYKLKPCQIDLESRKNQPGATSSWLAALSAAAKNL
jgi:hypothetical protein